MLKYSPAVFALKNSYQIMVMVEKPSLMWVEVGGKRYYDETNGILRSNKKIHRMTVPADELNSAGEYTVCERELIERRVYFTQSEDVKEYRYCFAGVEGKKSIRAFHISDTHSLRDEPVQSAEAFGRCDFLILNGDILDNSENAEDFNIIYEIASRITYGEIPIVFARGNHDMRGANSEIYSDYTPNSNGKTYYTFRLGSIWGAVLDCGEDKLDSHPEYGNTVCCHQFRLKQTEFIKSIIENAEDEYLADGVEYRIIISHIPFTNNFGEEYVIETELYSQWAKLIEDNIKPHIMIQGHVHEVGVYEKGSEFDSYGIQPCTVVTASRIGDGGFAGCGFVFGGGKIRITAIDCNGKTVMENEISAD